MKTAFYREGCVQEEKADVASRHELNTETENRKKIILKIWRQTPNSTGEVDI